MTINSADTSIQFDLVIPSMIAVNQKQVLRLVAAEVSKLIGISERILNERLIDAEKQSPSAMGNGIAVSHLHIGSLTDPVSVFIKLRSGVDFNAPDNQAVDLLCFLMTPEREGASYLRTMARLSRLLRNAQFSDRLREAEDEKMIRTLFDATSVRKMAA